MGRATALAGLSLSPRLTLEAHAEADFGIRRFRIYQPWRSGPSDGAPGPHLLSVNEYRPHRLADVVPVSRLTDQLIDQLVEMEGVVGIATAYQPLGRVTYSLSIWKSEDARRAFTVSPLHRRVMVDYRSRGYLRHIHWWGEHTTVGAGMAEATRRLDAGEGRRVGDARDRWARRDARLLAELESTETRPSRVRGRSPHAVQ